MHNAGMMHGYARVSTDAQDLTSQLAQLKAAGCEKVFREKVTGATADRPQLRKLMAALTQGDVVIVPAVDRLSRDTTNRSNPHLRRACSLASPYYSRRGRIWVGGCSVSF